MLTELTWSA